MKISCLALSVAVLAASVIPAISAGPPAEYKINEKETIKSPELRQGQCRGAGAGIGRRRDRDRIVQVLRFFRLATCTLRLAPAAGRVACCLAAAAGAACCLAALGAAWATRRSWRRPRRPRGS